MADPIDVKTVVLSPEQTRSYWDWLEEQGEWRTERRFGVPETNPYRRELRQEAKAFQRIQRELRKVWGAAQTVQPPPADQALWTEGLDPVATLAFSRVLRQGVRNAREDILESYRPGKLSTSTETEDAKAEEFIYKKACDHFHALLGVAAEALEVHAPTSPRPPPVKWTIIRTTIDGRRFTEDGRELPPLTKAEARAARIRGYEVLGVPPEEWNLPPEDDEPQA